MPIIVTQPKADTHFTIPQRVEGWVDHWPICLVSYQDGLPARRQVTDSSTNKKNIDLTLVHSCYATRLTRSDQIRSNFSNSQICLKGAFIWTNSCLITFHASLVCIISQLLILKNEKKIQLQQCQSNKPPSEGCIFSKEVGLARQKITGQGHEVLSQNVQVRPKM